MAECQILEKKNNRSSNVLVTLKTQRSVVENHQEKGSKQPIHLYRLCISLREQYKGAH